MKKVRVFLLFTAAMVVLSVFITGCTSVQTSRPGLQICSMTSGIGAVEKDRVDKQRLSYTINLCNDSDRETYITFVEPLLADRISERILSSETQIEVKKTLAASGSIEVKGELIFDSVNLSKQDIIAMEPLITGYRVGTEQLLELPGNGVRH